MKVDESGVANEVSYHSDFFFHKFLNLLLSFSFRSLDGNSSVRDVVGRTLQVPQDTVELLGSGMGSSHTSVHLVLSNGHV